MAGTNSIPDTDKQKRKAEKKLAKALKKAAAAVENPALPVAAAEQTEKKKKRKQKHIEDAADQSNVLTNAEVRQPESNGIEVPLGEPKGKKSKKRKISEPQGTAGVNGPENGSANLKIKEKKKKKKGVAESSIDVRTSHLEYSS